MNEDGEELLEVVSERGEVIGHASRACCHRDRSLIHRAVHLLVFDAAGRIYLQKRSATKLIQPGKWDSSVGGHLAPGESPEIAIRREMAEELDLPPELELTRLHEYLWRSPVETELVVSFRAVYPGPFRPDPDEIEEGGFFGREQLRELAAAGSLTPNLVHELERIGLLTGPGA